MSADNGRFASVGGDKQVFLWDVESGTTLRRWAGHAGRVEAVEFGGESDSVVVSGMHIHISYALLISILFFYLYFIFFVIE